MAGEAAVKRGQYGAGVPARPGRPGLGSPVAAKWVQ